MSIQTDLLQTKIEEAKKELPEVTQKAIAAVPWRTLILPIKGSMRYSTDQMDTLEIETELLLSGILSTEEYKKALEEEMQISKPETESLVKEVNELVFKKIKEKLIQMRENKNVVGVLSSNTMPERVKENEVDEKLDARFNKLEEDTKKTILALNYHASLYAIAQANKLNVEQMGKLEEMTTDVLTGALHADMLEQRLINRLGVTTETIKKILNEINDKILRPLRERMEINFGKPKSVEAEIKPTENTPNPINIRIIKPQINTLELKSGPPKPNPLILQKLSGSFQAPTTKTQYSLNNLSKPEARKQGEATPVPIKSYPPKSDPYRINPEE